VVLLKPFGTKSAAGVPDYFHEATSAVSLQLQGSMQQQKRCNAIETSLHMYFEQVVTDDKQFGQFLFQTLTVFINTIASTTLQKHEKKSRF
jgi:hypothetical protein